MEMFFVCVFDLPSIPVLSQIKIFHAEFFVQNIMHSFCWNAHNLSNLAYQDSALFYVLQYHGFCQVFRARLVQPRNTFCFKWMSDHV